MFSKAEGSRFFAPLKPWSTAQVSDPLSSSWLSPRAASTSLWSYIVPSEPLSAFSTHYFLSYFVPIVTRWKDKLSFYCTHRTEVAGGETRRDVGLFIEDKDLGDDRTLVAEDAPDGTTAFHRQDTGWFFYKWSYLRITRDLDFFDGTAQLVGLRIQTVGLSADPIKAFIQDARSNRRSFKSDLSAEPTVHGSTETYLPRPLNRRKYGYDPWNDPQYRISRPIATLDLPPTQKGRLIEDADEFDSPSYVDWYTRMGARHRRGYLLHGPPGTLKTSYAEALAEHLGRPLFRILLSDGSISDEDLNTLLSSIKTRSVVLFDDVDRVGLQKLEQTETIQGQRCGVSEAALMTALDGVFSCQSTVYVLTANHRERISETLLRPGRIDVEEEFNFLSQDTAKRMFKRAYEQFTDVDVDKLAEQFDEIWPCQRQMSPADFLSLLKRCINKPQHALDEMWIQKEEARAVSKQASDHTSNP